MPSVEPVIRNVRGRRSGDVVVVDADDDMTIAKTSSVSPLTTSGSDDSSNACRMRRSEMGDAWHG